MKEVKLTHELFNTELELLKQLKNNKSIPVEAYEANIRYTDSLVDLIDSIHESIEDLIYF